MTWCCGTCQSQNNQTQDRCRACGGHWTVTWKQSQRSRSKKKGPKNGQKEVQKQPKTSKTEKEEKDWTMCPERAPWIPTTPHGRLPARSQDVFLKDNGDMDQDQELPLPPQPSLPMPPAAPKVEDKMSEEEVKILAHLRGLEENGLELTDVLLQQKEKLEAKCNDLPPKSLSHSHLNRLDKATEKVAKCKARIKALDAEWEKFAKTMSQKIQYHSSMYQQPRGELMASYNQRLEELRKLRAEVDAASKTLLGSTEEETELMSQEAFSAELTQTLKTLSAQTPILVEDDEEMIADQEQMGASQMSGEEQAEGAKGARTKPSSHTAFRSPTRVAATHLKPKKDPA